MPRITIDLSGPSKGRFGQAYLDVLGEILETHFTKVTGLALNGKRWFLFMAWQELQSPEPAIFTVPGHIIGPDSVGYDAEITWREAGGWPTEGGWSKLLVRTLQRDYGAIQPAVVPVGAMPFEIEWRSWWDSHLPDFYLDVTLDAMDASLVVDRLRTGIRSFHPGYESIQSDGRCLHVHVAFGAGASISEHVVTLMKYLRDLHGEYPVGKVAIGGPSEAEV